MATLQGKSIHRGIHEPLVDTDPNDGFSKTGADRPRGSHGSNSLRQDAERALQFLIFSSTKPAVLLARDWHVLGIPFGFEHLALYQEIAAAEHCFIVTVDRADAGGIEHLLFATRFKGLRDEEYLACIDDASVPVPMVETQ